MQDSWRIKGTLTLNFGVRWELMQYWSEKRNQIPTFILGEQSRVYPTAPTSLVYPTDTGVPPTLVPQRNRFAPRLGLAYSPSKSDGILGKIIGGAGKTSIRTGYGIFYSVIQGNTIAFDEPQPPYGLSYTGNDTLFATPFITASDGSVHVNPFPLTFPPLNATVQHPNPNIDYSQFLPIAGMTAPAPTNTFPYAENYFLSIERQLPGATVLSLNYVGAQAHHLLAVFSANPGNAALCLSLSQPSDVAPGSPTCGPNGEDATYVTAGGVTVNGTRGPLGPAFGNDDYEGSVASSNYNSFQASVRHSGKTLDLSLGYTYSKSIDQASSLADILDPFNFNATRGLSAFDLRHNFVATYVYRLPLDRLTSRASVLTQGWEISGITRASSGFPVTLSTDLDNSLMGSLPNGVNNHSADLPDFAGGPLQLNGNPRNRRIFQYLAIQPERPGNLRKFQTAILLRTRPVQHRPCPAEDFSVFRIEGADVQAGGFQRLQPHAILRAGGGQRRFLQRPVRPSGERCTAAPDAGRAEVHVLKRGLTEWRAAFRSRRISLPSAMSN